MILPFLIVFWEKFTFAVSFGLHSSGLSDWVGNLQRLCSGLSLIYILCYLFYLSVYYFFLWLATYLLISISPFFFSFLFSLIQLLSSILCPLHHLNFYSFMWFQEHLAPACYIKIPTVSNLALMQFSLHTISCTSSLYPWYHFSSSSSFFFYFLLFFWFVSHLNSSFKGTVMDIYLSSLISFRS